MCTAWSTWQRLNNVKRDPDTVARELVRARVHLDFVMSLYREQVEAGRLFIHEHPQHAASWMETSVQEIMKIQGVGRSHADQCQYGQEVQHGSDCGSPIRKPTGFMSNGQHILHALSRRCSGLGGQCSRKKGGVHRQASGRVAREAAVYPPELCKAMIRGIMSELKARGIVKDGEIGLHAVCDEDKPFNDPDSGYSGKYRDDMSGQVLKDCLVQEARLKELQYFNAKGVWRKCNFAEAFANSGRRPISVRWVDVNKGD